MDNNGYSQKPLLEKLGIRQGSSSLILHAPQEMVALLHEAHLPFDSTIQRDYDFIHAFYLSTHDLKQEFTSLKKHLNRDGMLWISWPKKASQIQTELNELYIREFVLKHGLVDTKIASVSEIFSGLKFVYKLDER